MAEQKKVVVVKKINKGGHGAHGGSWKVAYADFMTAMMAFFLLMWLLSTATDEQKEAISYYFTTGLVMNASNASGLESILSGGEEVTNSNETSLFVGFDGSHVAPYLMSDEQRRYFANREQELFDRAKIALEEALRADPELYELIDNLIITKTPEGLNIQLIDQENEMLFASGSDKLTSNGLRLTAMLAKVIAQMPQQIAIEGHTDAVPFSKTKNYSNWELSADRALAFRRRMLALHVNPKQIVRVAGYAEQKPYLADEPTAPQNRRISMTLLSDYTAEAIREAKELAARQHRKESDAALKTAVENAK